MDGGREKKRSESRIEMEQDIKENFKRIPWIEEKEEEEKGRLRK